MILAPALLLPPRPLFTHPIRLWCARALIADIVLDAKTRASPSHSLSLLPSTFFPLPPARKSRLGTDDVLESIPYLMLAARPGVCRVTLLFLVQRDHFLSRLIWRDCCLFGLVYSVWELWRELQNAAVWLYLTYSAYESRLRFYWTILLRSDSWPKYYISSLKQLLLFLISYGCCGN